MSPLATRLRGSAGVFLALAAALALSAALSRVLTGPIGTAAGLTIATVKLLLIAAYFMRLREQRGLLRLAAMVGVAWLAVMLGLMLVDYRTRNWRTGAVASVSSWAAHSPALASGNSP